MLNRKSYFPPLLAALLFPACSDEDPAVRECRNQLEVGSVSLICPAFSVRYEYDESRTSFFDGLGREALRNVTATYVVDVPSHVTWQACGQDKQERDFSDTDPNGEIVCDELRHDSTLRIPDPKEEKKEADERQKEGKAPYVCGRSPMFTIASGGKRAGIEQTFVGYTNLNFLLVFTEFNSVADQALEYSMLSPFKVDGLEHHWSGKKSLLSFLKDRKSAENVERTTDQIESGGKTFPYSYFLDGKSGRSLFVGQLLAGLVADDADPRNRTLDSDFLMEMCPPEGGRCREGFPQWAVRIPLEAIPPEAIPLPTRVRAVHYFDFNSGPDVAVAGFQKLLDTFSAESAAAFDTPKHFRERADAIVTAAFSEDCGRGE